MGIAGARVVPFGDDCERLMMRETPMKSSGFAFFVGSVVCLIVSFAYPGLKYLWNPEIGCANPVVELGTVPVGQEITTAFDVANSGSGLLTIESVKPSCGTCLAVLRYPIHPIRSGEIGKIEVRLRTHGMLGPVRRTVVVSSNDPRQPFLILEVRATVESSVANVESRSE